MAYTSSVIGRSIYGGGWLEHGSPTSPRPAESTWGGAYLAARSSASTVFFIGIAGQCRHRGQILGQQIIRVGNDIYIGTVLKKSPPGGGL